MVETVPQVVDDIVGFQNSSLPPQTSLIGIAGGGRLLLSLFNLFKLMVCKAGDKYYWGSDLDKAGDILAEKRSSLTI